MISTDPKSHLPTITREDIRRGSVQRYFVRHAILKTVTEVDFSQYKQLSLNPMYTAISLNWTIGGYEDDIILGESAAVLGARTLNTNLVRTYEKYLPGISTLLRDPLQFFSGKLRSARTFIPPTLPTATTTENSTEAAALSWQEVAYDTIPTRGSNVDLSTTSPDGALNSGWQGYSYSGATNTYLVMTYGAIKSGIANPTQIYADTNFGHSNIRLYCDIGRLGVDRTGASCEMGLFYNSDDSIRLRILISRQTAGNSTIAIEGVDSVGATTTVVTGTVLALGTSDTYRFILEVDGNTVNAYYSETAGAAIESATLIGTGTLPSYIQALDRNARTIGFRAYGSTSLIAEHYILGNISVWNKI